MNDQYGPPAPQPQMGPPAPAAPVDPTAQSQEQLYQALLQNMMYDEEMSDLERQLAKADALRSLEGGPEGRQAGRVYVAANPLEFLGKGIQQYQGRKQAQSLEPRMQGAREGYKSNIEKVLGAL
jgi:hypothetical protein